MPPPHHPKHKDMTNAATTLSPNSLAYLLICKSLFLSIYKQTQTRIHTHRCTHAGTLHIIYTGDFTRLTLGLCRCKQLLLVAWPNFRISPFCHDRIKITFIQTNNEKTIRPFSPTLEHFIWLQPSFFCIGDLQLGHCFELVTSQRQLAAISVSSSVPFTEKPYRHGIIPHRNTR